MLGLLIISILAYYVLLSLWRRYQAFGLRDKMGLKGPETDFISGNFKQIAAYSKQPGRNMRIVQDWRKQYGDIFGYYLGPQLVVLVADLDLAKEILIKNFDCFLDRMIFSLKRTRANRTSLVNLRGEEWRQVRHAVTPTFTASKMKQMSYIINEKIDALLKKMEGFAKTGETFDIYNNFQALTLDVIGQCAFAVHVDSQSNLSDPFLVDVQQVFKLSGVQSSKLAKLALLFPEMRDILAKFQVFTKLDGVIKRLADNLNKVIQSRKKQSDAHGRVDVLQILLDEQARAEVDPSKWKLSDEVIVGNAFVFLLAGYETTSTALGYTAWLLAKHPDIQRRLQAEIDEKLEQKPTVDYDFVSKLPYMDAVFHESLRILPPVVDFVQRTCVKECEVGGIKFVPGVRVHIPVYEIHYDPEIWPEPEKFDPDRFLNNNKFPVTSWLPFGAGPRNCIGMRFADMEYKMALTRLLHQFNIVLTPDSDDPLKLFEETLLLRSRTGIRVKLEKR